MVLEQLYPARLVERRSSLAFLLGFTYAVIGIGSALLLFPKDPGLASIAFTSLILLPSLNKMISIEAKQIAREKNWSLSLMFRDHKDIFEIYFFLFVGIMMTYGIFSVIMPNLATVHLFSQQLNAYNTGGAAGLASSYQTFWAYVQNNVIVLIVCLLVSFIYGTGAIILITWNASVWGTVFGVVAKQAAAAHGVNPMVYFLARMVPLFPHTMSEAASYFLAAIAGGIISKAIIKEKVFSKRFNQITEDAVVIALMAFLMVIVAALLETYLTPALLKVFPL